MLQTRTVFLILLQWNLVFIIADGRYFLSIHYYKVALDGKSKKVKSFHAEVVTIDGQQFINAHIEFSENIKVVNVNGTLDLIRGTRKYRIYDIFMDFCKVIRQRGKLNMILVLYNQLSNFGYMPHSCPMMAHINYTITNFRVDTSKIPIHTPRINFFFDVKVFTGKEFIYNIIAAGIMESKIVKDISKTAR